LSGKKVFFLTGTDEHGQKVAQTAAQQGITPQELTDRVSQNFRDLTKLMNNSNDDFIRTTEPRHFESSQQIWREMASRNNGDIYQSVYKGWYSVRDEAYFDEDELTTGEGGQKFAPSGAEVKWVEEDSYFFRLSAYQDRLLKLYEEQPDFIAPTERRNEIISFVKRGLQDVSISRTTFDWGIPVRGTSCTCGWMRSPTTSRAWASLTTRVQSSRSTGRRICTSSARTSSGSTRCTGRRS
jgi:methionyl-tRNA synthetase